MQGFTSVLDDDTPTACGGGSAICGVSLTASSRMLHGFSLRHVCGATLQVLVFRACLLQLLLESFSSYNVGKQGRTKQQRSIGIALPVVTANHAVIGIVLGTIQNLGCLLGHHGAEDKGEHIAASGVTRRIAEGLGLFIVGFGLQRQVVEGGKGTYALELLLNGGVALHGISDGTLAQKQNLGGGLIREVETYDRLVKYLIELGCFVGNGLFAHTIYFAQRAAHLVMVEVVGKLTAGQRWGGQK